MLNDDILMCPKLILTQIGHNKVDGMWNNITDILKENTASKVVSYFEFIADHLINNLVGII